MARSFRDVWRWLGPSWLVGHVDDVEDEGARVTHTLMTIVDATLERLRQGLDARFPTRTGESANELTAADRGLVRGRSETLSEFTARLKAWRTPRTHRVRGNAFELLAQIRAYWNVAVDGNWISDLSTKAVTVDSRGMTHTLTPSGAITKTGVIPWDWDSVEALVTPTSGDASSVTGAGVMTPTVPACLPGALLFAHVFAESGGVAPPAGWTNVRSHSPNGTNYHVIFAKIATTSGGGTVTFTHTGAGTGIAIARITQVPGTWDATIANNFELSGVHSGSGTSVTEPTWEAADFITNALAFVGYDSGGTVNAFTGGDAGWSEVAAEATAGSAGAGVGIQTQYAGVLAGYEAGAGTCTLGNAASWSVVALRFRRPWGKFWIILEPSGGMGVAETPALGNATLWGGALGTPGYTLGQVGVTPADVLAMRNLFQQGAWHPEHAQPEWVVLNLTGDPVEPDGSWLHWSTNVFGTQVAARPSHLRFWSLDPLRNNVYAGKSDRFASATRLPDGVTTYAGDPEESAAWGAITMPNGVDTYTGDPENAAAWDAVLLLDDGSNA